MKIIAVSLATSILVGLSACILGCAAKSKSQPITSTFSSPRTIQVQSDPQAQYYLLEKSTNGVLRTLTTKRVGPSGTSYAKRLFNCSQKTVKYLAEGESLSMVRSASTSSSQMAPIVSRSIAYYLYIKACN